MSGQNEWWMGKNRSQKDLQKSYIPVLSFIIILKMSATYDFVINFRPEYTYYSMI